MNKKLSIFLVLTLLFCIACKNQNVENIQKENQTVKIKASNLKVDSNNLSSLKVIIKTVHGNIVFKFYPKHAPNTVTRFIELIQKRLYDGLLFHRVEPNFVIQGGDPTGSGTGGTGIKLKAEFNNIPHVRGTVAMARSPKDNDSGDSQFYIALATLPHLDRKYTVFGQVIEGLSIISNISEGDKILSMVISK